MDLCREFKTGTLSGTLLQASNHFVFGSLPDSRTQIPAWVTIIVIKNSGFYAEKIQYGQFPLLV